MSEQNNSYAELLEKQIEANKEEMIAAIQESVRIDSVKGTPQEGAPYGIGPKKALLHAISLGEKLGMKTGNADNRVGWVEYGDGEEMVGILGHLDVVPVGDGWKYPPFGAEIHENKMYGRGTMDDKGPTIGAIYALKAIKDCGIMPDRRIRVLFGTDEECGSTCVRHYIESGQELPVIGFTPDAEYPLIFCEKGITHITVGKKISKEEAGRVLSLCGGTAANVVISTCRLELDGKAETAALTGKAEAAAPADVKAEYDGEKTIISAVGKSAHGSTPELGVNAAISLLESIKEVDLGGTAEQMKRFLLEKVGTETNGKSLGVYYYDEETGQTTVNLGILSYNGEELKAVLDIRYPKNAPADAVRDQVTEAAGAYGLDILAADSTDLLYVPKDSELVRKLMKVYEEKTGTKAEPLAIGGGTYAKAFKNMVAFGPEFPGDENVIHQPNEYADLDRLMQSTQIAAAAMLALAQKE